MSVGPGQDTWRDWLQAECTKALLKDIWRERNVIHKQWTTLAEEESFRVYQARALAIDKTFKFIESKCNMKLRDICTATGLELE